MLDDSTFRYYFQRIVLNAGYYGDLTIHALRRAVANEVDSKIPRPLCVFLVLDADLCLSFFAEQNEPLPESETRSLATPHPMWATATTFQV